MRRRMPEAARLAARHTRIAQVETPGPCFLGEPVNEAVTSRPRGVADSEKELHAGLSTPMVEVIVVHPGVAEGKREARAGDAESAAQITHALAGLAETLLRVDVGERRVIDAVAADVKA